MDILYVILYRISVCTTVQQYNSPVIIKCTPLSYNLLYDGYRVSFQGVKGAGRGVNPPQSSTEVKERVGLYVGLRSLF